MKRILYLCLTILCLNFNAAKATDTLIQGSILKNNGSITSIDGKYTLIMQTDGSFLVYRSDGVVIYRMAKHGTHAVLEADGRLTEYNGSQVIWRSNNPPRTCTPVYQCHLIKMLPDGSLMVYWHNQLGDQWMSEWYTSADPDYATIQAGVRYPPTPVRPPGPVPQFTPPISYPATQGACNIVTDRNCPNDGPQL